MVVKLINKIKSYLNTLKSVINKSINYLFPYYLLLFIHKRVKY